MSDPVVQEMIALCLLHGVYDPHKIGRPIAYFRDRRTFLDFRGDLCIHPSSHWGWWVTVLTQSHDLYGDQWLGIAVDRKVWVEKDAWICSRALLYNCTIGEHAVVAAGAVVRNMDVPPYAIVEGNPARVIRYLERKG